MLNLSTHRLVRRLRSSIAKDVNQSRVDNDGNGTFRCVRKDTDFDSLVLFCPEAHVKLVDKLSVRSRVLQCRPGIFHLIEGLVPMFVALRFRLESPPARVNPWDQRGLKWFIKDSVSSSFICWMSQNPREKWNNLCLESMKLHALHFQSFRRKALGRHFLHVNQVGFFYINNGFLEKKHVRREILHFINSLYKGLIGSSVSSTEFATARKSPTYLSYDNTWELDVGFAISTRQRWKISCGW